MAFFRGPNIVTDGLILLLDPANTRSYPGSGTIITDMIYGLTASLINQVVYSSDNFGIFNFGGTDDYITISDINIPIIGDEARTIACWVYSTDTTQRQQLLGYGINTDNRTFALEIGTPYSGTKDNISLHTWNHVYSSNNNAFTQDGWHYCVITYAGGGTNSDNIKFYIDGEDAGYVLDFGSEEDILDTPNSYYKIGQRSIGGTDLDLIGKIGPVYFYRGVLSAIEVLQNFNALKGRFGL